MEITPAINDLTDHLAHANALAEQAARRAALEEERDIAAAGDNPDHVEAFASDYERDIRAIEDPAFLRAAAERNSYALRERVASAHTPAMPQPLRLITWHEMRHCRGSSYVSYAEGNRRMLAATDERNAQRARYHQHRVNDAFRYAYATALDISPNLFCFTEFQSTAARDAQRNARPTRASLNAEQESALQEARVIAQASTVYLRRLARLSQTERNLFGASLPEFVGVSMERACVAATAIGSEGPAAGMVHALYGALFTSADEVLNERARDWNGARIHLTHSSRIFGAFCAHNGNVAFDPPLEALVIKMRDDIDAGRDIGPIEPIIYALADALTNY